jgi:nitrous oxidase accessory protein NosD
VTALALCATSGVALAHGKKEHGKTPRTLYVAHSGRAGASDRSCNRAAFSTVQSAVDKAPAGSTVVVCGGSYAEDVIISTPLTLTGRNGAVIHATSTANGMCEQLGPMGPGSAPCLAGITIKSSHVTVQKLKVTGAIGEGILATGSLEHGSISDVVIRNNRVVDNDNGGKAPSTTSPYPQCASQGGVPGDCGEGIHLMGVAHSLVRGNFDSNNTGGVLVTDEFGPTHANLITRNIVTGNKYDCGITVPGHNPMAVAANGQPQPSVAGVYDNTISHNKITNNGRLGEGAGVLFANATAGTGSYDNVAEDNIITGNGLSGVTMHAHTVGPGQTEDLNGNVIKNNTIGRNNLGGDDLDGTVADDATTGILVFSGTVPVKVTISHNSISSNKNGIWLGVGGHVSASMRHNVFHNVTTQVFTSP